MKIIDLSVPIYDGMDVYPGDPAVRIRRAHTYESHTWELRELTFGTHTGTHVDACSHMHKGGAAIDRIPLERFFGRARVVRTDDDWPRSTGLLFEEAAGMELLDKLLGCNPGFVGGNITEELERALLGEGIITYTRLANLDQLPLETDFMFYGFPLLIRDGDGSPVRAVAIVE